MANILGYKVGYVQTIENMTGEQARTVLKNLFLVQSRIEAHPDKSPDEIIADFWEKYNSLNAKTKRRTRNTLK